MKPHGAGWATASSLVALLVTACVGLTGLTGDSSVAGTVDGGDDGAPVAGNTEGCQTGFMSCPPHAPGSCETFGGGDPQNCGACRKACVASHVKSAPACRDAACVFDCADGFADCDGDPSNGCEADLASPKSCGACGHDCGRGGCKTGACTAEVLAPGESCFTCGIHVDATNVFWWFNGDLVTCPKTGCATPTVLMTGLSKPAVAFDGATFFEADNFGTKIVACAKTGCGKSPVAITTTTGARALAVDATRIYWIDSVTSANGLKTTYQIFACPKTGCVGSPQLLAGSPGANLSRTLEIAGSTLLWASDEGVRGCTLPSCGSVTTLAASPDGYPPELKGDGASTFFFSGSTAQDSYSCPVTGCGGSPTPFSTAANGIVGLPLAFDGTTVYVGSTIYGAARCTEGSCSSPTTVPMLTNVGFTLATDETYLYWVADTSLVRAAK